MFVDAHCHLDFDQYDEDRETVIAECRKRLTAVINSGTNLERNQASLELAQEHDIVYATMGLHPTYIKDIGPDTVDRIIDQVRRHADDIVAVGEIGLDYHHVTEQDWRQRQEDWFTALLDVAAELGLPAVIHSRDAEQRCLQILAEYDIPVLLHCFNGHPDLAWDAVDRGFYVSVSTQVLYSSRVQAIVDAIPLEAMTLETDAPFLYQGERNMPWHIEESAQQIAEITGRDVDQIGEQTTANAAAVFDQSW